MDGVGGRAGKVTGEWRSEMCGDQGCEVRHGVSSADHGCAMFTWTMDKGIYTLQNIKL
jgi:hypothetical protein